MTQSITRHSSRRIRNPPATMISHLNSSTASKPSRTDPLSSLFQPPAPPQHNVRPSAHYINVVRENPIHKSSSNPNKKSTKQAPDHNAFRRPKQSKDLASARLRWTYMICYDLPQSAGCNGHLPCKMHRQTEKDRENEQQQFCALGSAHLFVLFLVLSLKRLRIEDALGPVQSTLYKC